MSSRSADATIKGYYYQFDTSILRLLELVNDTDKVHLERIEDIDIETASDTTAIQCKYLSRPKYQNSVVREPIMLMLDYFVNNSKEDINYILYAHFEEEIGGYQLAIDVQKLKDILSYREAKVFKAYHVDNKISDGQLETFLTKFKLIFGDKFEVQQQKVIEKIKDALSCDEFEADTLHYNNALRLVIDKSCSANSVDRIITKADFYNRLHISINLFNAWYIKLRSKAAYIQIIRNRYRSSQAERSSKGKVIFIGEEILSAANTELPITTFIENLIHKYYRLKHCFRDALPLTIVLEANNDTLKKIKTDLADAGHLYNDGYEDVKFNSSVFNSAPIVNLNTVGNRLINLHSY